MEGQINEKQNYLIPDFGLLKKSSKIFSILLLEIRASKITEYC